jgi:hypothetical protein
MGSVAADPEERARETLKKKGPEAGPFFFFPRPFPHRNHSPPLQHVIYIYFMKTQPILNMPRVTFIAERDLLHLLPLTEAEG